MLPELPGGGGVEGRPPMLWVWSMSLVFFLSINSCFAINACVFIKILGKAGGAHAGALELISMLGPGPAHYMLVITAWRCWRRPAVVSNNIILRPVS
uniref:Putative secreted peptide n=1 Tax=Anopheles braziliensis TaxID=58242 RepID=A0A2M3ZX96_9DIPT